MEWQKLVSHALQRASTALPGQILGEARASMPQWFRRPCLYLTCSALPKACHYTAKNTAPE